MKAELNRMGRIRLFPLLFQNGCSQSSRFLSQPRRIVGSGDENGLKGRLKALANEDTLLPTQMFPRLPARPTFLADPNFVSGTQKMFDFVQKHFVSAANVSQFAQPKQHHGQQCVRNNVSSLTKALNMISSPYCAVSEPNVYKHYKRLTRWNANRCYSLRITYLMFETFQTLFPTASLIFTAVKVFIK